MRTALVAISALLFCLAAPCSALAVTGGGDINFTPKGMGPVIFSHDVHVNVKGLKCNGCHYAMFMVTTGSYKMDRSKITKADFCSKCHNGQKSFDVSNPKNCSRCHK